MTTECLLCSGHSALGAEGELGVLVTLTGLQWQRRLAGDADMHTQDTSSSVSVTCDAESKAVAI